MHSVKRLSEPSVVKSKGESNIRCSSCKVEIGAEKNNADQVSYSLHGQEFSAIRAHCLAKGTLFEDPTFSASDFSLYSSPPPGKSGIKWIRPQEIVDDPQFVTDGYSRFDVKQGGLGDCWFLSSCASLASKPHLFEHVVPKDNGNFSDKSQYAGIFHFRFWHYGRWVEVVVDDRLPVNRAEELLYGHSSVENEFWSALLEKAYAKLHGSYQALEGGTGWEGTVDLTGGLAETHLLKGWQPIDLFERLEKSVTRDTLVTAGINDVNNDIMELVNLRKFHEYSVTRVERLNSHKHMIGMEDQEPCEIRLICLRNPWGSGEWNRSWSDGSSEWEKVTSKKRNQLSSVKQDGEFWMHFDEFVTYFDDLTICHQYPAPVLQGQKTCKPNEMITLHGEWVRGVSAGGSDSASFWRNPQYLIQLDGEKERSDESNEIDEIVNSPICVTIGLMQKHSHRKGVEEIPIRFLVFPVGSEVSDCTRSLPKSFFDSATAVDGCPEFKSEREVVKRLLLPAGRYVIVPHTWKPQLSAEFMMRILSEGSLQVESLEQTLGCTTNGVQVEKHCPKNNLESLIPNMTIKELQKMIQSAFDGLTIDEETLRSLVCWYGDRRNEGCLRSDETEVLLQNMTSWELIFRQHCTAPDGKLCTFDLRNALFAGGVLVDTRALSTIVQVHKYCPMDLGTFVVCAMETREIIEWCTMRGLAQPTTAKYFKELYGRRKLLDMCLKSQLAEDVKSPQP